MYIYTYIYKYIYICHRLDHPDSWCSKFPSFHRITCQDSLHLGMSERLKGNFSGLQLLLVLEAAIQQASAGGGMTWAPLVNWDCHRCDAVTYIYIYIYICIYIYIMYYIMYIYIYIIYNSHSPCLAHHRQTSPCRLVIQNLVLEDDFWCSKKHEKPQRSACSASISSPDNTTCAVWLSGRFQQWCSCCYVFLGVLPGKPGRSIQWNHVFWSSTSPLFKCQHPHRSSA